MGRGVPPGSDEIVDLVFYIAIPDGQDSRSPYLVYPVHPCRNPTKTTELWKDSEGRGEVLLKGRVQGGIICNATATLRAERGGHGEG